MARSRNIKPGFYKNEDLAECSVWARFVFPGLWMLADRAGRLEDRPKRIKGELLPFDAQDVEPLLKELASKGFIVRYKAAGESFIQISKFSSHQSPHYSEKASVISPPVLPEYQECIGKENSGSTALIKRGSQPPDSLIPDSLIPESSTHADNQPESVAPNGARHATDFSPTFIELPIRDGPPYAVRQALLSQLEPLYPAVDVPQTLREMKGWLIGHQDRLKTGKKMRGFIANWLQREQEKHGRQAI